MHACYYVFSYTNSGQPVDQTLLRDLSGYTSLCMQFQSSSALLYTYVFGHAAAHASLSVSLNMSSTSSTGRQSLSRLASRLWSVDSDSDCENDDASDVPLKVFKTTSPESAQGYGAVRCNGQCVFGRECSEAAREYATTLNLEAFRQLNIIIKPLATSRLAGKILQHVERRIEKFIEDHGGPEMAVFKLGICAGENVLKRMMSYRKANFRAMLILHVDEDVTFVECLEAMVIRLFGHLKGCRNVQLGGESMREADSRRPRFPPPYVAYMVASRADINAFIGA